MGCTTSQEISSYGDIFKKNQNTGESGIYRNLKCMNYLAEFPTSNTKTIQELLQRSYNKFGNKPCFGTIKNRVYEWRTYKESIDIAKSFGSGIIELGISPPPADCSEFDVNFMAIYSKNREEVAFSEFACSFYGWTSVPIYDTLGVEALEFIFDQTEVELLVCSLENLVKLIKDKRFGKLKTIITYERVTESSHISILSDLNLKLFCFEEVLEVGKKHDHLIQSGITPSSISTFSYTSGTTGKPKGAILSHGNFLSVIANSESALDVNEKDIYLSYLPLAHVLEKIILFVLVFHGCSIGFYGGDVQKLKDDMSLLKPTIFVTVPRLLLRFHDAIKSNLEKLKGCKRSFAEKGMKTKLQILKTKGSLKHLFYDKLIFKKMKIALGGRVRWILVGSAPTSPEVLNFLKIGFCCNVLEGYGQTESTGTSFVSNLKDNKSAGSVGGPCDNTEFKLIDVPEMNYTAKDKDSEGRMNPRGEICIRGPGVFKGYYKEPEKTKEAIDEDGWLHTGDVGQINLNGSLKIIDRKKNIFKLSHGEYVAAEKIESVYLQNKCVTEIFVYGDSFQSYLVGIIVPNLIKIKEFAEKNHILTENIDDLLQKKEIKTWILSDINTTAKEAKLFGFEMVKNIYLEKDSFGLKNILTSTFKIKRHDAKNYYQKVIEKLYQENVGNN